MNSLERLWCAAKAAGIAIKYDENVPTSHTGVVKDEVLITLGKAYILGNENERAYLLAHELAHIARGELLIKDVNHDAWNIAADDCIAEHLRKTPFGSAAPAYIVTHEKLVTQYPKLIDVPPTRAQPIYDVIMEAVNQAIKDGNVGADDGSEDGIRVPMEGCGFGSKGELEDAARGTAARAQGRLLSNAEWQDASKGAGRGDCLLSRPSRKIEVDGRLSDFMRTLRLATRRGRGVYQRVRSWAREGRVPELPGRLRRPVSRVVVAVDVSGSMVPTRERVMRLVKGIERDHEVIWISWASTAQRVRDADDCYSANVGGGTYFEPALILSQSFNPDVLLVISDGVLSDNDFHVPHKFSTIWAIVGTKERPPFGEALYL